MPQLFREDFKNIFTFRHSKRIFAKFKNILKIHLEKKCDQTYEALPPTFTDMNENVGDWAVLSPILCVYDVVNKTSTSTFLHTRDRPPPPL